MAGLIGMSYSTTIITSDVRTGDGLSKTRSSDENDAFTVHHISGGLSCRS